MEEDRVIGLHLMQPNQRAELTEGKIGFFWKRALAVARRSMVRAPASRQKKKKKTVRRGTFGSRFADLPLAILARFFPNL